MAGELAVVAKWTGLISSVLTVVLGFVHLVRIDARVKWPSGFIDDDQQGTWRAPLFTFQPDAFFDIWTPMVLGVMGIMAHIKQFPNLCAMLTKDFTRYFIYLLVTALFGNLGYNGGLGIIVGAVTLLAALFALISIFVDNSTACLDLSIGVKLRARNG
eukprot:Blabericola_migrator_1__193@NODE_1051_length_5591_cov_140_882513_g723_i0_p3_GENE_NODE_1051_length_5591_cov_140_882513_g723_i0NODE_1051_length_5591_cov_140_882513_g723_i0_p3_ORF_typecomplete_len158_score13_27Phage_holin_1/PF04531_13/34Phage_holin_1/PF04531_13/26Formdeh_trans/PF09163_11/1_5Formdeh_trans/PF09163_11/2_2e03DUF2231/PF09990_9/25DUF2231/PF09990_9/5_7e02FeoB_associated/PF12669_7/8_1e03FeoB_associated/PF12669_7/0_75_NODE_1051_length_5591_cov_140_882513_g723_i050355508